VRTVRAGGISVPLDSDSSVESVETYVTAQLAEQTSIERPIINAREQIAEARIRMRAIVSKAESAL
jgi:hypothetical protein